MEEKERGTEEMKKVIGFIRDILIGAIIIGFMMISFFGAVLQTSYRLSPVTAQELQMEVIEK